MNSESNQKAVFDAFVDRLIYGTGFVELTRSHDGETVVKHVPFEEVFPAPVPLPPKGQTIIAVAVREYTQRIRSATAHQKESLL